MLAFLMGVLMVAPYAYFALTAPDYAGIAMMGQDAEEHYLARMQEAYEGRPALSNVFTPYKDAPYLSPGLGEAFVAGIARVAGRSVPDINIGAKFLFPAVIFLLIYVFGLTISRSRLAALTGATLGMLGVSIMSNPHELLALLNGNSLSDGSMWARPINPELSGILLFGGLWLLYRAYAHREHTLWPLVGTIGATIGLSLYLSPYVWSFLGVLLLALFIAELIRKNPASSLRFFSAGVLGLALAIPFLLNYIAARVHPGYAFASQFAGIMTTHLPSFGIWIAILLILPFLAWRGPLASSRTFFILCGLSLLIALNQQVVTGLYLQPGHYHWYITKPLVGIMLGLSGTLLLIRFLGARIVTITCSIGIIALFAHGTFAQQNFYTKNSSEALDAQAYAPLFAYLNSAPATSIYANPTLSNYLAIYTNDDAPGSWYAGLYLLPVGYLHERLFLEYRLRGITADESLTTMKAERHAILMQLFLGNWSGIPNDSAPLPDSILEGLAQEYRAYADIPISDVMRGLRITYVLQDKVHDEWTPLASDLIPDAIISGRFVLYRLP